VHGRPYGVPGSDMGVRARKHCTRDFKSWSVVNMIKSCRGVRFKLPILPFQGLQNVFVFEFCTENKLNAFKLFFGLLEIKLKH
jgi:hypothetical protein